MSLLTALTEILDNADSENLSPFDSIPDSELLASPREGSVSVRPGEGVVWFDAKVRTMSVGLLTYSEAQTHLRFFLSPSCTSCSLSLGHPQNVTSSRRLIRWGPVQAVVE